MVKNFLLCLLILFIFDSSGFAKVKTKPIRTHKTNLHTKTPKKTSSRKITRRVSQKAKKAAPSKDTMEQSRQQAEKKHLALLKRQEQERVAQQKQRAIERRCAEDARQQSSLKQQEKERIQGELLAAQQRQAEYAQKQQEEKKIAQSTLFRTRIERKINGPYFKSYQTNLFINGYKGQNTVLPVIQEGFYYTLSPGYRPVTGDVLIAGLINDWYSRYKGHILPPLSLRFKKG